MSDSSTLGASAVMGGMGSDMVGLALLWFRAPLDDRHGQPRHAHQAPLLVADLDAPHVAARAEMEGARGRRDEARGYGPQVVGVDLLAQAHELLGVDAQHRGDAAGGL